MPIAGPFYFAWVEPDEITFDVSHHRMDEYIFAAKRILAEGEKPLLEIEIQNPHIGILNPARKYWAWFAWDNGSAIVPLFFGRVVGTPAEIFEEVIKLQLVADPLDYKQRVQRVAETLKVSPFYDPVFIDVGQRDDPNSILEAWAKVWDVDPVTHEVTANDIITGDSNLDFTADDHFYDAMQMTIGQPPATAILMDASVSWTQSARGIVDATNGYRKFTGIGGDGIISDWPKAQTDIGGGYKVYFSDAFDTAGAAVSTTVSYSSSWTNNEKEHSDGDTLSQSSSYSMPMGGSIYKEKVLTWKSQPGFMDPFAVDGNGDPAPVNIPLHYEETTGYIMGWSVAASLVLQYNATRARTERVIFRVAADTQAVLTQPELSQNSEVMTRSGADVGVPILDLLNWNSIAGTAVAVGQIIFPDNPSLPGGKSAQVCTTAGTAGTVAPDFSDIEGVTTVDGSVTWSSLGAATPPENATDWTAISHVAAGAIILPSRPFYVAFGTLMLPGTHVFPQVGLSVSEGQIVQAANGSFQVCTLAGEIPANASPAFSTTWGTVTAAGSSQWTSLGMSLPSGTAHFMATTSGTTGALYLIPPFDETLHATTSDGSVTWTSIGSGIIPAGGIPGDVHTATYFATDRGRQSLEYLAALVRAKLLYRARCIEVAFDCDYGRGVSVSTRKTATLHDPRIAGGVALGKIKGAELSVSDSGVAGCRVTIACCAGKGNAVEEVEGDPSYVAAGYVDDGYQWFDNATIVLPGTTDLGYAPPAYTVVDDGLTFPLTRDMITAIDVWHEGADVSEAALTAMADAANLAQQPLSRLDGLTPLDAQYRRQQQITLLQANSLPKMLKENPSWQEFQFKPVNGGPFNKVYNVRFSDLSVPMGIDLQSGAV
jgi:hypothetical protein